MAASQPLADGLPSSTKSFRDVLSAPFIHSTTELPLKERSSFKGEPALIFSAEEISALAAPFQFHLVGKFMGIRPSMDFLRKGFSTIGFCGDFQLGLLDAQHVLIRFTQPADYHRCWMHGTWHFKKFIMKVLKWTPEFSPEREPPIVPVWVSFENLPIHFFQTNPLLSMAALLGKPLKIDAATTNLTRPSVARVCVEINLNQQLPKRIWIGQGISGFWQSVIYENLPDYCKDCSCLGHASGNCNFATDVISFNPNKRVWQPKKVQALQGASIIPSVHSSYLKAVNNEHDDLADLDSQQVHPPKPQMVEPILNLEQHNTKAAENHTPGLTDAEKGKTVVDLYHSTQFQNMSAMGVSMNQEVNGASADKTSDKDQIENLLRFHEIGFKPQLIDSHDSPGGNTITTVTVGPAMVINTAMESASGTVSSIDGANKLDDTLVVMAQKQQNRAVQQEIGISIEGVCSNANVSTGVPITTAATLSDTNGLQQHQPKQCSAHIPIVTHQQQMDVAPQWQQRVDVSPVASAPSPVAASPEKDTLVDSAKVSFSAPAILESRSPLMEAESVNQVVEGMQDVPAIVVADAEDDDAISDYAATLTANEPSYIADESDNEEVFYEDVIIEDKKGRLHIISRPKQYLGSSPKSAPVHVDLARSATSDARILRSTPCPPLDASQHLSVQSQVVVLQDDTPFQQPKHRARKNKKKPLGQVDTSRQGIITRSRGASFNVLPEEY